MTTLHSEDAEFDLLWNKCRGAHLNVTDNMYYGLRLVMPGFESTSGIRVDVIVSGIHKFTRQKKSAELLFMLTSFFVAVSVDAGEPNKKEFKAKITVVLNRFLIAVLEEGLIMLVDDNGRNALVSLLPLCVDSCYFLVLSFTSVF